MRVVLQRVARASVSVDDHVTGAVGPGVLLLVGIGPDDSEVQARWMARKIAGLRIFVDEAGRMNRSLLDIGGGALVVSQFTLYGDCSRGRRPSFVGAAPPERAEPLYERFCALLAEEGVERVARGMFGAHMRVDLLNDGPVTLVIEKS